MESEKHLTPAVGRTGRPRRGPRPAGGSFGGLLGQSIRSARVRRGLTIAEASARSLGLVTVPSWSAYEVGTQEPRVSRFLALCIALDARPSEILPPASEASVRALAASREAES